MEELLHYVWKYRLFQKDLTMTDGTPVEVVDVGMANTNEGPDFFNAKIKVAGQTWVGNVEIHKTSKDWNKHKHHINKVYNNVILHVVETADCEVFSESGERVPQCEIKYPKHIKDNIEYLLYSNLHTPCGNYLREIPDIYLNGWLNTLLMERLERKSNDIQALLQRFNNSWDDVFYVLLTRNFGFGLNSDSFERLALSLPLNYIHKQRSDIRQIEALLFGQAGMLEQSAKEDEYFQYLQREYSLLKHKYSLKSLDSSIFNKLRLRPGSHPHIRIAQLSSLLYKEDKLFSKIIGCDDVGKIRLMLHENASEYWQTHYIFGEISPKKSKFIGDNSLDVILINTVVPILFSYGKYTADENLCDRAFNFLEKIKSESNSIVKQFASCGIKFENAADSQAVIQLKREYCEKRKCLFCRIGYHVLTDK